MTEELKIDVEYTEKEAAAFLGVQPQSLRANRYRGTGLPYVKRGTRVTYRRSDVLEYVKGQLVKPGK